MIRDYISAALAKARYDKLDDKREPFYGEVPGLKGVWASGRTLEECRERLADTIDGWLVVRLKRGLTIPAIGKHRIQELKELKIGA